jgi:hypothetical protein
MRRTKEESKGETTMKRQGQIKKRNSILAALLIAALVIPQASMAANPVEAPASAGTQATSEADSAAATLENPGGGGAR